MSIRPWEADRPLTTRTASATIGACFAEVDARGVQSIGAGWEFDAFLTTDGWVFRFPRRAHCEELFAPERRVHGLVSRFLPMHVHLPHVELTGRATEHFPYTIAGHRFIAGVPADTIDPRLLPTAARDIGLALGAFHAIPESDARAADVGEMDPNEDGRIEWLDGGLRRASALTGLDPVVDEAVRWAIRAAHSVPAFDGPLRFIHHDLSPEHILVDPATGRLTGILDWTDAILGDAARDFVALIICNGWSFVDEVLLSYPHAVDDSFRQRLGCMARLLSVIGLAEAHERRIDVEKHVRWVHNAFARGA